MTLQLKNVSLQLNIQCLFLKKSNFILFKVKVNGMKILLQKPA